MWVTRGFSTWTARFGVRVVAAVDWTKLAGYSESTAPERAASAHGELQAYLTRLTAVPAGTAFEVRWSAAPGAPPALVLLGRVRAATEEQVRRAAATALAALSSVPTHVVVEALPDEAAVAAALTPFAVHRDGLAEIRRPCVTRQPKRVDARLPFYLAVPAFGPGPHPWPRLLGLLAESARPAMVTVGLEPTEVPVELGRLLPGLAAHYGALGRPGAVTTGISGTTPLPGEPFAQWAAQSYQDAADRLRGTVFRVRVTVATSAPLGGTRLPDALATMLAPVGAGTPCAVAVPVDPSSRALAHEAIGVLGVPTWGDARVWQAAGVAPEVRLLTELADVEQAAALAWLPVPGGPAGFPVVDPAAADLPQGRNITISGELHLAHGDFVGVKNELPRQP